MFSICFLIVGFSSKPDKRITSDISAHLRKVYCDTPSPTDQHVKQLAFKYDVSVSKVKVNKQICASLSGSRQFVAHQLEECAQQETGWIWILANFANRLIASRFRRSHQSWKALFSALRKKSTHIQIWDKGRKSTSNLSMGPTLKQRGSEHSSKKWNDWVKCRDVMDKKKIIFMHKWKENTHTHKKYGEKKKEDLFA